MSKKQNTNCCVFGCTSTKGKDSSTHFHYFPEKNASVVTIIRKNGATEDVDRRTAWEYMLQLGKSATSSLRVCSKHFTIDDYRKSGGNTVSEISPRLKVTAVPSKNLPSKSSQKRKLLAKRKTIERKEKARIGKIITTELISEQNPLPTTAIFLPEAPTISIKNELVEEDIQFINSSSSTSLISEVPITQLRTKSASVLDHEKVKALETYKNRRVCRFCLNKIDKPGFTSLITSSTVKVTLKSLEIHKMIETCLPSLNLNLSSNPVICEKCSSSLSSTYQFMTETLRNQETITSYMSEKSIAGKVNLNEVQKQGKKRPSDDSYSHIQTIKKLKQFNKSFKVIRVRGNQKLGQLNDSFKVLRVLGKAPPAFKKSIGKIGLSREKPSSDVAVVEVKVEPDLSSFLEYPDPSEHDYCEPSIKNEPNAGLSFNNDTESDNIEQFPTIVLD